MKDILNSELASAWSLCVFIFHLSSKFNYLILGIKVV